MTELVAAIFSRVGSIARIEGSGRTTPPMLQIGSRLVVSPSTSSIADDDDVDKEENTAVSNREANTGNASTAVQEVKVEEKNTPSTTTTTAAIGIEANISTPPQQTTTTHEIVSVLSPLRPTPFTSHQPGGGGGPTESIMTDNGGGYGVEALCEVLSFVISFVSAPPTRHHSGLPAHGLELILAALHAAGSALELHPLLVSLLRQDLLQSMFAAAREGSLACLAGICQVALALYTYLSRHMLLQLEALLSLLLLPMAEGRGVSSVEAQQVALEGVLDFCNQPGFIRDVYLNLDCRIERSNLFEQICTLLSKSAFPVNGPVSAVHVLSLDGIMSILSSLGAGCEDLSVGGGVEEAAMAAPPSEPETFLDIWTPLSQGIAPKVASHAAPDSPESARAEKYLKSRLAAVAEHFNRDAKKGFQLGQSLNLLPAPLDAAAVGRFLRCCPGLSKPGIGEVLGERDAFYDGVRAGFINTFDFSGLEFDIALRLFMDAFRPPGEGQKIDRIMQIFGQGYYEQMPGAGLASADAAYVLAFSVIMLNTDLHNTQNKKKMSLKDFARINDNTNDGAPMPKELLQKIYAAIANDELKISSECAPEELPGQLVFWIKMARDAQRPRGRMLVGAQGNAALEKDMFMLIWGPTLASVSVILDGSSDPGIAYRAMDGLLEAARLAAYYGVPDVGDQLLGTLAKYTIVSTPMGAVAVPTVGKPGAVAYGESEKCMAAVEATFAIANRYGDSLRGGWRHVLESILRLHRLGVLSPAVIAADGEDVEDARARLPVPNLSGNKRASSSLFTRAINSLISIEGDAVGGEAATAREEAAAAAAARSAEACRVEELIADSKFLVSSSSSN